MSRWISWVAVSSKPQHEKESPKTQRRDNLDTIERHGGTLVAELEVPGESRSLPSFEVAEREIAAYAQLRQLLDERAADVIVFMDVSRLGRTTPLAMSVMHECLAAGVALYDRSSPPPSLSAAEQRLDEGQLVMSSIKASYAAIEIQRLVKRRKVGMRARVRNGQMPGRIPYGYRREFTPDGSSRTVLVEDEADIIRHIFDATVKGKSQRQIARELNQVGVSPPRSRSGWSVTSVSSIQKRAHVYAGYTEIRDKEVGLIRAEGNHQAIIDLATAQLAIKEIENQRGKPRGSRVQLFSGVLICDQCGGLMYAMKRNRSNGEVYRAWQCGRGRRNAELYPGAEDRDRTCVGSYITEESVLDALDAFVKWARNGVNLRQLIEDVPFESRNQLRKVEDLAADILGLEQERDRLLYMTQRGILSMDEAEERIREVDERLGMLRTVHREIAGNLNYETLDARRDRLYNFMRNSERIFDQLPITEANALLRQTLRIHVRDHAVIRIETI